MLRGGTGLKAARGIAARLASIPEDEERVLLATGRYIGEGFDDARLDTLFLTLPVSWRGPLRSTRAACTGCTIASAKSASTTTPT